MDRNWSYINIMLEKNTFLTVCVTNYWKKTTNGGGLKSSIKAECLSWKVSLIKTQIININKWVTGWNCKIHLIQHLKLDGLVVLSDLNIQNLLTKTVKSCICISQTLLFWGLHVIIVFLCFIVMILYMWSLTCSCYALSTYVIIITAWILLHWLCIS